MKKTILNLGLVLLTVCPVMAQKKTSQYPEATSFGTNDLVLISYWNGSNWTTNKFLRSTNLFAQINALSLWTNSGGTIQASSANIGTNTFQIGSDSSIQMSGTITTGFPNLILGTLGAGIVDLYDNTNNEAVFDVGGSGGGHWFTLPTLAITTDAGSTWDVRLDPIASDGTTPFIFNSTLTHTSGNLVTVSNATTNQFVVNNLGGIITGLPSGATNAQPFKIGSEANAVGLVLVATNYIQIELNGVAYKLGLVK